ncbi:unnamed protein product [Amoebophrya sp. A25]|nr:unnamed protein product [Amoebophrya sp. A25]|eukprot:GSA25T00008652001.1
MFVRIPRMRNALIFVFCARQAAQARRVTSSSRGLFSAAFGRLSSSFTDETSPEQDGENPLAADDSAITSSSVLASTRKAAESRLKEKPILLENKEASPSGSGVPEAKTVYSPSTGGSKEVVDLSSSLKAARFPQKEDEEDNGVVSSIILDVDEQDGTPADDEKNELDGKSRSHQHSSTELDSLQHDTVSSHSSSTSTRARLESSSALTRTTHNLLATSNYRADSDAETGACFQLPLRLPTAANAVTVLDDELVVAGDDDGLYFIPLNAEEDEQEEDETANDESKLSSDEHHSETSRHTSSDEDIDFQEQKEDQEPRSKNRNKHAKKNNAKKVHHSTRASVLQIQRVDTTLSDTANTWGLLTSNAVAPTVGSLPMGERYEFSGVAAAPASALSLLDHSVAEDTTQYRFLTPYGTRILRQDAAGKVTAVPVSASGTKTEAGPTTEKRTNMLLLSAQHGRSLLQYDTNAHKIVSRSELPSTRGTRSTPGSAEAHDFAAYNGMSGSTGLAVDNDGHIMVTNEQTGTTDRLSLGEHGSAGEEDFSSEFESNRSTRDRLGLPDLIPPFPTGTSYLDGLLFVTSEYEATPQSSDWRTRLSVFRLSSNEAADKILGAAEKQDDYATLLHDGSRASTTSALSSSTQHKGHEKLLPPPHPHGDMEDRKSRSTSRKYGSRSKTGTDGNIESRERKKHHKHDGEISHASAESSEKAEHRAEKSKKLSSFSRKVVDAIDEQNHRSIVEQIHQSIEEQDQQKHQAAKNENEVDASRHGHQHDHSTASSAHQEQKEKEHKQKHDISAKKKTNTNTVLVEQSGKSGTTSKKSSSDTSTRSKKNKMDPSSSQLAFAPPSMDEENAASSATSQEASATSSDAVTSCESTMADTWLYVWTMTMVDMKKNCVLPEPPNVQPPVPEGSPPDTPPNEVWILNRDPLAKHTLALLQEDAKQGGQKTASSKGGKNKSPTKTKTKTTSSTAKNKSSAEDGPGPGIYSGVSVLAASSRAAAGRALSFLQQTATKVMLSRSTSSSASASMASSKSSISSTLVSTGAALHLQQPSTSEQESSEKARMLNLQTQLLELEGEARARKEKAWNRVGMLAANLDAMADKLDTTATRVNDLLAKQQHKLAPARSDAWREWRDARQATAFKRRELRKARRRRMISSASNRRGGEFLLEKKSASSSSIHVELDQNHPEVGHDHEHEQEDHRTSSQNLPLPRLVAEYDLPKSITDISAIAATRRGVQDFTIFAAADQQMYRFDINLLDKVAQCPEWT